MQSECSSFRGFLGLLKTYDKTLVEIALTHPSYTADNNLPYTECYERLEFLGDAVLKLLASDYLYKKFPDYNEGQMSEIRSYIVSDEILARIAEKTGLINEIKVSQNDKTINLIESVGACALEAVFGALYLCGKFEYLKEFFECNFKELIDDIENSNIIYNPKAILQEFTQKESKELPVYTVTKESGAAHEKVFEVRVCYKDKELAKGEGKSKKAAQQDAALKACTSLGLLTESWNKNEK